VKPVRVGDLNCFAAVTKHERWVDGCRGDSAPLRQPLEVVRRLTENERSVRPARADLPRTL